MNYIQQAFKAKHEWWMYLIGTILTIFGAIVFSLPHLVAALSKEGTDMMRMDDPMYLLSLFDPNTNFVFLLLPFVGGILCLFFAVRVIHQQKLLHLTTSRAKLDWGRVFTIFLFWGIFSSAMVLIDYFVNPEGYVLNFDAKNFAILALIGIVMVPIQTSLEEYLFRGYLMQGLGVALKNKWIPLILSSVAFGALHFWNPEVDKLGNVIMIYYIGTGFFLGIMTLMDEGLELALGFHAANNLFTALLVTADWTAFQTYSIFKDISDPSETTIGEIFVPVFVIFPMLLFILSKVYKWNNWKEKLFGQVTEPPKDDYKIVE